MGAKTAKRLAILIVVIGILGVSAYFIRTFQISRMAQSIVARAERAEEEGKYAEAVDLYNQHLRVVPKDTEVKVKLADAFLKAGETRSNIESAKLLYSNVLETQPTYDAVRRKLAMQFAKLGDYKEAQPHLAILLQKTPEDGELEYQLGRCLVNQEKYSEAERELKEAIQHAPKLIEAYADLAALLRDQLKRPQDADQVIDAMIKAMPDDPTALLARGRYRSSFDLAGATDDFQKALKLQEAIKPNPKSADIYLELARLAQKASKFDEARKILEDGIKNAGDFPSFHLALASISQSRNQVDQAIADLQRGLKSFPDSNEMRLALAEFANAKGDADGLLEQIEELKRRINFPAMIDYLTAQHFALLRNWPKARQHLNAIQGGLDHIPAIKANVHELMARCLGELGDPEAQEASLRRAVNADPKNIQARIELIQKLVGRGDINQAITQYTDILKDVPQVWSPLARLMIYRNLFAQTGNPDWTAINNLIDDAEKREPNSPDPAVMRAEVLVSQAKSKEAAALLDQVRRKYPKSLLAWVSLIDLTARQLEKPEEALKLYEEASKELGDRFELRLERARIITALDKSGSEAEGKAIEELAENIGAFSASDRRRLLENLANEAVRAQCSASAYRLYQRCAEEDPSNLILRWRILNLAFRLKDKPGIEKQIEQIKKIEGTERLMGAYADAWYLSWQAEQAMQAADEAEQAKKADEVKQAKENVRKYRAAARTILDELASRRPDWSVVPLAYATLEEQELLDLKKPKEETKSVDTAAISRLQDSLVNHYLQAINGNQTDLMVVRRAAQLLFEMRRYDAYDQMLRKLPIASLTLLSNDFKRMSVGAAQNKDYDGALEIAKKSVEAKPTDFLERIWLAEVYRLANRLPEAETELRTAVRLAGTIADPWVVLIQFLAGTNQLDKAEATLREAQTALAKDQLAIALAQGQESMAKAYEARGNTEEAKTRIAEARKWYLTAESEHPKDSRIRRMLASFFLRNGQVGEVQSRLRAILSQGSEQDAAEVAWARRTLALTLLAASDQKQAREALDFFKDRAKTVRTTEDRRVLVQVLLAQKVKEQTAEAIEMLNDLAKKNEATAEDRMLLAQLYSQANDWPKAQQAYTDLLKLQPDNRTCLARYASELIARIKPDSKLEIAEAEKQIDKLKQSDPDWETSFPFTLELELHKAKGENDKVVAMLNLAEKNPKVHLEQLGLLAEKIGQVELAEKFLRNAESQGKPNPTAASLNLATFLGRHGRLKEAVDLCEKAQAAGAVPEEVARVSITALFAAKGEVDNALASRVSALIEKGIQQNPQSPMMTVALGNVRERQQKYDEAKALYQQAIKFGSKDGIPLNNLAWLTALKDNQGKTALDLINRAIDINGPIPDFLDTRGVAYLVAGDSQRAIEDLEKAVEGDSSSPSKLVHLAQAYLKSGNKERAKQSLDLAKVKGLEVNSLHPLEVISYRQLIAELGK